jgi:hypothetical protein
MIVNIYLSVACPPECIPYRSTLKECKAVDEPCVSSALDDAHTCWKCYAPHDTCHDLALPDYPARQIQTSHSSLAEPSP